MKEYAKQYYELGLNPTCISYIKTKYNSKENNPEKSPCHAWKRWQVRRPLLEEVLQLNWDISNGIGAVLGHTSRCIDIDNCSDLEFVKEFLKLLKLPEDYNWVVKSPSGYHIHILSGPIFFASNKELIDGVLPVFPNEKFASIFSKIELRWANHIVLPPTRINGKSYHFIDDSMPKEQPARVAMFVVFQALSKFCGNYNSSSGNFEAQKMVFQLAVTSEGYPYADAARGSNKEGVIKDAMNSVGYIDFDVLPKSIKVGHLEFGFASSSFPIYTRGTGPEFFIDIETTGLIENELDYEKYPRIIQIAFYNSRKREYKTLNIKPDDFKVPEEIEKLTGISNDFLLESGVDIKEALNSIDLPDDSPIIGHNLDFDLSVIDSEYLRINKRPKTYAANKFRNGSQTFCTMRKFASIFNVKYPKLAEMYAYFFDDVPQKTHDATSDLTILVDCYYIMCLYGYIIEDYENKIIT